MSDYPTPVDDDNGGVEQTSGTWTPEIEPGTAAGDFAITYSVQDGTWTKTGDIVEITFDVRPATANFSTTTGTGNLTITNLPYTSDKHWAGSFFNFGKVDLGVYTSANPCVADGGAVLTLRKVGSDQNAASVQIADPTVATIILTGSITYRAA